EGLRESLPDTVAGAEVDTRHTAERRPGGARGGVLTVRRGRATGWRGRPCGHGRCGRGLDAGGGNGQRRGDLGLALPEWGGGAIDEGQRLLQHTQMLLAPRPWQGQGDGLGLLLAAGVAQGCQGRWGARTGNEGAEDPLPGVSRASPEGWRPREMQL